jgi:DNA-directed RNA polymerase beta' subunit
LMLYPPIVEIWFRTHSPTFLSTLCVDCEQFTHTDEGGALASPLNLPTTKSRDLAGF